MARRGAVALSSTGASAEIRGFPEGGEGGDPDDFDVASDEDAMQPQGARPPPGISGSSLPWVLVSGPVGRVSLQLERYEHIVLVAGGIGITPLVPVFVTAAAGPAGRTALLPAGGPIAHALLSLRRDVFGCGRPGVPPPPLPLQTLSLLWSVRERGLAACFETQLSAAAGASAAATLTSVDIFESRPPARALADGEQRAAAAAASVRVEARPGDSPRVAAAMTSAPRVSSAGRGRGSIGSRGTRSSVPGMIPASVEPATAAAAAGSASGVRFHDGRPDVAAFLHVAAVRAVEACNVRGGSAAHPTGSRPRVAVLVCGPQAMVDAVCDAAAASGGPAEFHVHTEAFLL